MVYDNTGSFHVNRNALVVTPSERVGIGTYTPAFTLDVLSYDVATANFNTPGTNYNYINLSNDGAQSRWGNERSSGNGLATDGLPYATIFGPTINGHELQFMTYDIVRTTIDTAGKVGIGTTHPTNKLSLYNENGDIDIGFGNTASLMQFVIGIDYSDGNKFKLSSSPTLGTSDLIIIPPVTVPSTAYTNTGGTGSRAGVITVTDSGNIFSGGNGSYLVNGILSETTTYFLGGLGTNKWITFDFGGGNFKLITEAKFYQQNTTSHGIWKWQGSNNNSTWTDIGSTFTLGGATTQTITTLSTNIFGFRYYRMFCTDGDNSGGPYLYEMEFKINAGSFNGISNVGIGTTPINMLDVAGNISCSVITASMFTTTGNLIGKSVILAFGTGSLTFTNGILTSVNP
jgi:hypothetical protein